jgi:hypothetical protein
MAAIIVHKKSSASLKYTVSDSRVPKLIEMNKSLDPRGRYDSVMIVDSLLDVSPEK